MIFTGSASSTSTRLFKSFWMAGFESACHINSKGRRIDMIAGTEHDYFAEEDYLRLGELGIWTVRDAARWHLIDQHGCYDFSSLEPLIQAALSTGTQVIWTLCHYGWPDGLDMLSPAFVERFARFSAATATYLRSWTTEVPFYCPVNEISFFAWAASRPIMFPYLEGRDDEIKQQLVRATIASCKAILSIDPRARFVYPEPVINIVDAPEASEEARAAARSHLESQYEAWDMIAGLSRPQLGGNPRYLDVLGLNYYHSNQWEHGPRAQRLRWEDEPRDPRWLPFREMIGRVWRRYRRPLCIAETSHFGSGRARWISEIGREAAAGLLAGIPLEGVCIYPILDRYDWDDNLHWHNSGLFDISHQDGSLKRILNIEYATALREVSSLLSSSKPRVESDVH